METNEGRLTAKALAALLNGREYGQEITSDEATQARDSGLVVVFGYSDDNMEFAGAIHDEVGCYGGGTAYLTAAGLLANKCDDRLCPYFAAERAKAATSEAVWCDGESHAWKYRTSIPHETFEILEDGEPYCVGIVFALADVGAKPTTWQQRLIAEHSDLDNRLAKLNAYLETDACLALPFDDRALLAHQARIMGELLVILGQRVQRAKGAV